MAAGRLRTVARRWRSTPRAGAEMQTAEQGDAVWAINLLAEDGHHGCPPQSFQPGHATASGIPPPRSDATGRPLTPTRARENPSRVVDAVAATQAAARPVCALDSLNWPATSTG